MAGDAVVGALRVVLGMDTASFEDGSKKAGASVESFGKKVLEVAAGIGLEKALESAGHAFIDFGKNALETADQMFKLSQKTGIPIEQLGGLAHAADLSGISAESLSRGIKNLQIEITKSSSAFGPAVSAIQFLGLSLDDIKTASPLDAIKMISDGIVKLGDGTNKASVTAALFGKKMGDDLIPLLNKSGAGIQEIIDQATKLGLTFSGDVGKNAEEFNDKMKELGKVTSGIALQALGPLSQGMAHLSQVMVDWIANNNVVGKSAEGLVRIFNLLLDNINLINAALVVFIANMAITGVINFGAALITLTKTVAGLVVAVATLNVAQLLSIVRFTALAALFIYVAGGMDKFITTVQDVRKTVTDMLPPDTMATIEKGLKAIGINTESLTKEFGDLGHASENLDPIIQSILKTVSQPVKGLFDPAAAQRLHDFNLEIQKLGIQGAEVAGVYNNALAPGFFQAALSAKVIKADLSNVNDVMTLMTPQANILNQAMLALAGARLTQEFLTPWQLYQKQLEQINLQLATHNISADTAAQASQKAAATSAVAWGQAAATITGGFADAFKSLAEQNKKFAGIAKAAAIANALVNTYVAANKALADPTLISIGLSYVAAAAVTAAGLANVAKIASTQFASGGSFKVGGSGGIDSQLVHFAATPGEMVDVRKPGQTGPSSEIIVRGIGARDFFTGDMLRSMIDGLNAAHSDGYKLKFAE